MKQKKTEITILGEQIAIEFNLAVEVAYEEIADRPFDIADLVSQRNSVALYMAAIITANPDTAITVERLMKEATGPEIESLSKAVIAAMTEWLHLPQVLKKEQPDEPQPTFEESQGEKKEKN